MAESGGRPNLRTEALIAAYALSRLDRRLLEHRGWGSWRDAFESVGQTLQINPNSIKRLRDEFDPIHDNGRVGHVRPLRPTRQRVAGDLCGVSEAALLNIFDGMMEGDETVWQAVVAAVSRRRGAGGNVAERLATGRAAERIVLQRADEILGIAGEAMRDRRDDACGYDFETEAAPGPAIEVKGLRGERGGILFTDHEWNTALRMRGSYLLVVVGRVFEQTPCWRLIRDPSGEGGLRPRVRSQASVAVNWSVQVSVGGDAAA